ncbi:glycosyltransferase [Defluviimonas sp. WL0050]|uniref:Glycosyltransferase n=1 Tax=Albidovulum litorale TaxID=2984134 RepID=A0ABT2ZKC0_9RHOB|nr:glycosyltransferase [Defluviimonas sp. WL0050]MCV2871488.1 glycosyltransferase [Defluviimonas sp. WL0050]
MTGTVSITVVVPAFRAAHLLPRVLAPLMAMHRRGDVDEVIVVDDVSPDDTATIAADLGARVIIMDKNGGPGAARNRAAEEAKGDVLWFVDSDVIAWEDGAEKVRAAFADPEVAAVFGSYDSTPDGQHWFSRYKNLMHRFYHQRAERDAHTFWAGCGAVRKDVFRQIGGFDIETYRVPSIEDIELGYRIRRTGGRIVVDPTLLGKHLKVWTPKNAIHTDIFRRALPWSRLMISREGMHNDLNTSHGEKAKALVAGLLILSLLALPFTPGLWPVTLSLLGLALIANTAFVRFMFSNGGLGFAILTFLYHQVYYVYSAAAFAWCLFEYHVLGVKNRLHVP